MCIRDRRSHRRRVGSIGGWRAVASALEYKDRAHGCAWDWVDWALTVAGAAAAAGVYMCL